MMELVMDMWANQAHMWDPEVRLWPGGMLMLGAERIDG